MTAEVPVAGVGEKVLVMPAGGFTKASVTPPPKFDRLMPRVTSLLPPAAMVTVPGADTA
jgi:hypothetical protein